MLSFGWIMLIRLIQTNKLMAMHMRIKVTLFMRKSL